MAYDYNRYYGAFIRNQYDYPNEDYEYENDVYTDDDFMIL